MTSESQIRVLIAEDEDHLRAALEDFLAARGYAVTVCADGKSALRALQEGAYHVALIDLVMPEMDGLEVLRYLRSDRDAPEVLIITGPNTIDTAISAIKLGAYDYLPKPIRMSEVDVMVRRAWEKRELLRANSLLRQRIPSVTGISTNQSDMIATVEQAGSLAASDDVLVLHGEVGVGKNHMARFIHSRSGRPIDMYTEVQLRQGTGDLFKHLCGSDSLPSRGSFRVPVSGLFQVAENGTIVIDTHLFREQEQARLIDIIRERSFTREGSGNERFPLRTRVILCAQPTESWVTRIPAVHLSIPPLRDRLQDIPEIASELLSGMSQIQLKRLEPDAYDLLESYPWPGNIRELKAVLDRVCILSSDPVITAPELKMSLVWETMGSEMGVAPLDQVERLYIETVLQRSNWHQGRAADILGISTKTLYRKMREYGFVRPRKRKLARVTRTDT